MGGDLSAEDFSTAEDEASPVKTTRKVAGQIAELLERQGLDAADLGRIQRVNAWQGYIKKPIPCENCGATGKVPDDLGDDGQEVTCPVCAGAKRDFIPETVDMVGVSLSPSWEEGPQWPVVQPAAPTVVRHRAIKPVKRETRVTALLPDPQIGFLRLDDGTLIPMHDEQAMDVSVQLLRAIRPDRVINLGDFLDMSEWSSKFVVYPEYVQTTQPALDRGNLFLAEQKAACDEDTEFELLGGNHDDRLSLAVARNAKAALRLRQANTPESWPVLSIPHLLRLDDLGVTYMGAYPAGRIKVADAHGRQSPLYALHGERLDMKKQAERERYSTVQGHSHHFSCHAETYDVPGETPVEVESWSIGCLCRTDGAVPSTKGALDDKGRPFIRHESWQQGVAIVTEDEDGWDLDTIRIRDGIARWNGKSYTAK